VTDESKPDEPAVRVVDRRWWVRADNETTADERGARKPTYVEELERQIADQAAQLQTFMTEHRRSLEEFEQVKTRMRREVAREVERGKRTVLAELLDVVDNLDRAIGAAQQTGTGANPTEGAGAPAWLRGVSLVRDQFLAKLETLGVTRIGSLGQPFDARLHEAISTTTVHDLAQDGRVVAVVREGFAIGDDLLRPAAVVVGKFDGQA
jgi:molecular chaperone GrpE